MSKKAIEFKNRDRFIQTGMVRPFSLDILFNIADAPEVEHADLMKASLFPDEILNK